MTEDGQSTTLHVFNKLNDQHKWCGEASRFCNSRIFEHQTMDTENKIIRGRRMG